MATNYERGRDTEYKVIEMLEKVGYTATRTAGSHGAFDVVAWRQNCIRLIQVKREADAATKYDDDIQQIMDTPIPPNSTAELWVYSDKNRAWRMQKVIKEAV